MNKSKLVFAFILIVTISIFALFSCLNKRKTKSLNNSEQDSLKEVVYSSYFTSINDSLSSDTALFKAYKNELQEQVFHYMSENSEAMDEYNITSYSSQGEILNTYTYFMASGGSEPLVPLIVNVDELPISSQGGDSTVPQFKEGVYYQSENPGGIIKLSPQYYNNKPKQKVIMMPQSYYNRLTVTSYRNVNASGEQRIIDQLFNSLGGLGAESDIINTLNNNDPTWAADIVMDWTKQNFDYLNTLNNNTYQPTQIPKDITTSYQAAGATVITHNPPPVVFGAGVSVSSSGAVMVGTNKIHANCKDFNNYLTRFGVTDTKKNYPKWMGVTVLHSWKMQIKYSEVSTVFDGKHCIKATNGQLSFLQPDYHVFIIEWFPTNKDCEPVAKMMYDKTRKHETKHVKDLWDIVAMAKANPTLIPNFEVCGAGNTISSIYHSKLVNVQENIAKKLTDQFEDFSLLVDMETIGYCGCED